MLATRTSVQPARRVRGGLELEERLDDVGVEVGPAAALELGEGLLELEGAAVRAVGSMAAQASQPALMRALTQRSAPAAPEG